jgi:hypothetical protein
MTNGDEIDDKNFDDRWGKVSTRRIEQERLNETRVFESFGLFKVITHCSLVTG